MYHGVWCVTRSGSHRAQLLDGWAEKEALPELCAVGCHWLGHLSVGIPLLFREEGTPGFKVSSLAVLALHLEAGGVEVVVASAFSRRVRWKLEAAHN